MNVKAFRGIAVEEALRKLESSIDGLTDGEARRRLRRYGLNEINEKKESRVLSLLKRFWGPIPLMLEIIVIISFWLSHLLDVYIVLALLLFNAVAGFREEDNAQRAVELLKKHLYVSSRVLRGEKWATLDAKYLVPGDIIRVRAGDIIPADSEVIESSEFEIDQSTLTGESFPIRKHRDSLLYSGSIVKKGEATALVVTTGKDTYYGKTAKLVENAKPHTRLQTVILSLAKYLVAIDIVLIALITTYAIAIKIDFLSILPFDLVILIASVPVALPAAFTVAMAVGTKSISDKGVIVTKLSAIEEASTMNILCMDKTGTITENKLSVYKPVTYHNVDYREVIRAAALASRREDKDPIDLAVISSLRKFGIKLPKFRVIRFLPFDPATKRSEAIVNINGKEEEFYKGNPHTIMQLTKMKNKDRAGVEKSITDLSRRGFRTIGVASKAGGRKRFLGVIPIYDRPRAGINGLVKKIADLGVRVKILTGDNPEIATEVSREVGLGTDILNANSIRGEKTGSIASIIEKADGIAEIYPEDKYAIVKALQSKDLTVGMTGDGVNDAPALKEADLGIAVSSATDVAKASSDIVLTSSGLGVIISAIKESRKIFERMVTYTIIKIVKIVQMVFFLSFGFLALGFLPIRPFQLILLIFLNDIASITLATDNEQYSSRPDFWSVKSLIKMSVVLGIALLGVTTVLSLLGLYMFRLTEQQFQTFLFLTSNVTILLSIFSIRERRSFWSSAPSKPLIASALIGISIGVLMSTFGLFMTPISAIAALSILAVSFAFLFVLDGVKLSLYSKVPEFRRL
jgi:H+-transporting ATPase